MNICETMNPEYSRQENFIVEILDGKRDGTYVELGAYHSKQNSNTYHLEKNFNWRGVSFEVCEDRRSEFDANRKNTCYGDALTFDYIDFFK